MEVSEGTALLNPDGSLTLYRDDLQEKWDYPEDTILQSFTAAQRHFIESLQNGRVSETNGPETLNTMALGFAAYRSAAEGQVVKPEF